MCGIAAVFGSVKNKKRLIKQSLEKITHRGTSFFEIKQFPRAVLGANRLPITGPERGQQPFANENNTVCALLNGEIFNYKELKASLRAQGYSFKTNCDTEVLVYLYEQYGNEMVYHIDSEMYAFVAGVTFLVSILQKNKFVNEQ